jgi:hypothetical protein
MSSMVFPRTTSDAEWHVAAASGGTEDPHAGGHHARSQNDPACNEVQHRSGRAYGGPAKESNDTIQHGKQSHSAWTGRDIKARTGTQC